MKNTTSTIFSIDPETGDKTAIGSLEDKIDEDQDDDDNKDNFFAGMNAQEWLDVTGEIMDDEDFSTTEVQTGDEKDVYIQSVFPQSRRFTVSLTKPSLSTKNYDKKQHKLAKNDTLRKMEGLGGTECNRVVKAVSKSRMNIVAHPIQEFEADLSVIVAGIE